MQLSASDFEGTRLKRAGTVPVLFTASWCPFCRMFNPIFESALREKGIEYASVDLSDYENPLWDTFGISIVPTVVVFREGKPAMRKGGVPGRGLSEEVMEEVVRQLSIGQAALTG